MTERLDTDPDLGPLQQVLSCGNLLRAGEVRLVLIIQLPHHLHFVLRHRHPPGQRSCSRLQVPSNLESRFGAELAYGMAMIGGNLKTNQLVLDVTTICHLAPIQVRRQTAADLPHRSHPEQRCCCDTEPRRGRACVTRPSELAAERAPGRAGHAGGGFTGESAHTRDVGRDEVPGVTSGPSL